jgi:NAD(P)-dependent dehydrogenase (short-subunit alcohol dehydrogenase family)
LSSREPIGLPVAVEPAERRTIVITGASYGIGRATAQGLARSGKTLVLVARRKDLLAGLASELRAVHPTVEVCVHPADLALVSEVRRVAAEIRSEHPRVDVLINNAGAYFARRTETREGIERTFALNVLAPFLLTIGLREPLRAGAPSRVVMVASAAHEGYHLRLSDLEGRTRYSGFGTYGRSKLALILLAYEFADRWRSDRISVNALHPGFVASRFGRNNPGFVGAFVGTVSKLFGTSVVKGAATSVFAAASPEMEGVTGRYLTNCRIVASSPASYDRASGGAVWEYCAQRTGAPQGSASP